MLATSMNADVRHSWLFTHIPFGRTGVHLMLNDLLPHGSYFRFNPPLMAACAMDEVDPRRLNDLLADTHAYIRLVTLHMSHAYLGTTILYVAFLANCRTYISSRLDYYVPTTYMYLFYISIMYLGIHHSR